MKKLCINWFARACRWWPQAPASGNEPVVTRHLPDPLELFLLARRERFASRATNPPSPLLRISTNHFSH